MTDAVAAPLLKLIRQAETGDRYDVAFGFNQPNHKPLTAMTIAEVRAYQEGLADGKPGMTACGAYQIIRKTMIGLIREMQIDEMTTIFDQSMQDSMAMTLLNRRGYQRYLSGQIDWQTFAFNISKEWASFPRVKGGNPDASYYAGDGINHAQITVAEVSRALPVRPFTGAGRAQPSIA